MKKTIAFALALICVLALSAPFARASDNPSYLLQADKTVVSGDTILVRVGIQNNSGIISLRFRVEYDDNLELIQIEDQGLLEGMSEPSPNIASPYILKWSDYTATTDNTANGTVVTLAFRAKDGVVDETASISIAHIEGRNAQGEKVQFEGCSMSIDITCAHSYVDGVCTVCGEEDPNAVTIPALRLSRASVSFEDEIWYNMYYTASGVEDVVEMGLLVFDTQLADGKVSDAVQVLAGYDYDGTYYMTHTDGVAAKNMGDTMYYRVYAKLSDGSYAYSSNTVGYNAISYANSILRNSTNDYMKALVVAMLNYGAEAQTYFGYRTDSLMNAGLTAEHQALVRQYNADTMPNPGAVDSSKNGIFTKTGFGQSNITASFEAAFAMNYYVNPTYTPDGEVVLYYWTEEDYATVSALSAENASGAVVMTASGSQYWGAISGIAAKEMGKTIYAGAVYTSGGVTYSTVVMNYSMGKYCDTIAGRESSAQRELSKAAAVYGASAKDYFDNL